MKIPYIMTSNVTITSDFDSSGHWGDHTLICNVNNTDWSAAIQKIAHAILSKEYPKVYMPVTILLDPDDFNKANANPTYIIPAIILHIPSGTLTKTNKLATN